MKRQKVLIGLMCCAVGYAAYVHGADFITKKSSSTLKPQITNNEFKIILGQAGEILNKHQISPLDRSRIQSATTPWESNPFYQKVFVELNPIPEEIERSTPTQATEYVYEGFVDSGNKRWAIINGKGYQTGDVLDGSEFVLIKIEKTEIEIKDSPTEKHEGEIKKIHILEISIE